MSQFRSIERIPGSTRFYEVLQGSARFGVLRGSAGFCKVRGSAGFCRVRFYRVLRGSTRFGSAGSGRFGSAGLHWSRSELDQNPGGGNDRNQGFEQVGHAAGDGVHTRRIEPDIVLVEEI